MQSLIDKARVLMEALPYIRNFNGKVFVIKAGGKALTSDNALSLFAMDVSMLKLVGIDVVVVHGGGPEINELLKRVGKKTEFYKGLRVTDEETLQYVEMALAKLNMKIVRLVNLYGGKALGLSGNDCLTIIARKKKFKNRDIGLVGEVYKVKEDILFKLVKDGFIPVLMPLGVTEDGTPVNINADNVAAEIASAMKAEKLMILTDVDGVLDEKGKIIPSLSAKEAKELMRKRIISEGMIPKVESCVKAVRGGVSKAHIINGNIEHSVLLEIFTKEGIGTEVIA